jgi:hypothetical protein
MNCDENINIDIKVAASTAPTSLDVASEAIGIDLQKPIDLSKMKVINVSFIPERRGDGTFRMLGTADLGAFVINGNNEEDYIEVTITRRTGKLKLDS